MDKTAGQMANDVRRWLRTHYPDMFRRKSPKPLAIGTHLRLVEHDPMAVAVALHRWTLRRRYQKALAAGGPRYTLEGEPCGEITPAQSEYAKRRQANIARRKAARAALQGSAKSNYRT